MKKLLFLVLSILLISRFIHATATEECWWHAAYFDVRYINNYGGDDREENFVKDVVRVMNVVIRLDSLLKNLREQGKLEHFTRWELIDDYMKSYSIEHGSFTRDGKQIHLRLTDSIAINKALRKLWQIKDFVFSPSKPAHLWLFSLHIDSWKLPIPTDQYDIDHGRPDSNLLWLCVEGDLHSSHGFLQHEKDGYYHRYTGLYLSRHQVIEAQKLLSARYNLKTTITSHYITPAIIRKYALW